MHEQCCVCGTFLQPECKYLDQDDAYEVEGNILCEDCVYDWVKRNCYKKLKEEELPFQTVPSDYGAYKECYPIKED